jgi:hypothetical protein
MLPIQAGSVRRNRNFGSYFDEVGASPMAVSYIHGIATDRVDDCGSQGSLCTCMNPDDPNSPTPLQACCKQGPGHCKLDKEHGHCHCS